MVRGEWANQCTSKAPAAINRGGKNATACVATARICLLELKLYLGDSAGKAVPVTGFLSSGGSLIPCGEHNLPDGLLNQLTIQL